MAEHDQDDPRHKELVDKFGKMIKDELEENATFVLFITDSNGGHVVGWGCPTCMLETVLSWARDISNIHIHDEESKEILH